MGLTEKSGSPFLKFYNSENVALFIGNVVCVICLKGVGKGGTIFYK